MNNKKNLLLVGFVSTTGGISKNIIAVGNMLSPHYNLFSVVGDSGVDTQIAEESGRLILPINRRKPFQMINPLNYYKLNKYATENDINVVLFLTDSPANYWAIAALKQFNRYAYLHNPKPHKGTKKIIAFTHKILNRSYLKNCNKVFVASYNQKSKLENDCEFNKYFEKIKVIYLGIQNEMLFDIPNEKETIDVLFFGRIKYYKGIDILVDAMKTSELREYNCTVIGKGDLNEAIGQSRIIPSNVTIINRYVTDEELAHYINKSKIVVLPYREATGTQIAQTVMYYSKPLVATNVGSLPEYIEDGKSGTIVEPENVKQLSNAIYTLLKDEKLRFIYGENGKESLKKFSNEAISMRFLEELGV